MNDIKKRRIFLREICLVGSGVGGGMLLSSISHALPKSRASTALDREDRSAQSPEDRLRELNITLPPFPQPVAVYVPAVRVGDMLFTSGHGPRRTDGTFIQGKVGRDLSIQEGYDAARLVGLNTLATIRSKLGSLDRVVRLVKVLGMVNSDSDFGKQPQVINGFSELMVSIFGETSGKAARSAVGMGSLPSNIPVEIEAIFQVR